jgi:hypothetical protein
MRRIWWMNRRSVAVPFSLAILILALPALFLRNMDVWIDFWTATATEQREICSFDTAGRGWWGLAGPTRAAVRVENAHESCPTSLPLHLTAPPWRSG